MMLESDDSYARARARLVDGKEARILCESDMEILDEEKLIASTSYTRENYGLPRRAARRGLEHRRQGG